MTYIVAHGRVLALRANEAVEEFAGKAVAGEQGDLRGGRRERMERYYSRRKLGRGVTREGVGSVPPALSRSENKTCEIVIALRDPGV